MLPLVRASLEPIAASVDPLHASARAWVMPKLGLAAGGFWIVDDTAYPKRGKHSAGVARQYCGALGHLRRLLDEGLPRYCVLADAGYGVDTTLRHGLSQRGLPYLVGITSAISVWPPGTEPLPPKPTAAGVVRPCPPRRVAPAGERQGAGAGTGACGSGVSNGALARGDEPDTAEPLCCLAGLPCWRQRRARPAVAGAMAADRMAARPGGVGEVSSSDAARSLYASRAGPRRPWQPRPKLCWPPVSD